jgi:CubicO group peptidase (beta-lactamase class C family)
MYKQKYFKYKQKYFKYKQKYFSLKKIKKGIIPSNKHSSNNKIMDTLSKSKLESLKEYLDKAGTHAIIILHKSDIIFQYGDITNTSYIASMRKSILAILYGMYDIDLTKTLKKLNIDNVEGLSTIEKTVTIENLMTARSGIYHPASNPGDNQNKPKRGTKKPGECWIYNNWDFNVLGTIFRQETGVNIYDALNNLGKQIGFEDYDLKFNKDRYNEDAKDKSRSIHPSYHMGISTRDLSKIGLLMLNKGLYKGKQIVSKKWIKKITSLVTSSSEVTKVSPKRKDIGYGYMWWVYDKEPTDNFEGAYFAAGFGEQLIYVIPKLEMVIVLKKTEWDRFSSSHIINSLFD